MYSSSAYLSEIYKNIKSTGSDNLDVVLIREFFAIMAF